MTTYGYCASGFVLNSDNTRVLFVFHKRLQRRIQPGGHIDQGEIAQETVLREVFEETGLQAVFHPEYTMTRGIVGSYEYGEGLIIPYLIRKYDYKASSKPYDYQIDNRYILMVDDMTIANDDHAIEQVEWFDKEGALEAVGHDPKLKYLIEALMK